MKEIEDFELQALEFLNRIRETNKLSFYLLKPLARELFETYNQGVNDTYEGKS